MCIYGGLYAQTGMLLSPALEKEMHESILKERVLQNIHDPIRNLRLNSVASSKSVPPANDNCANATVLTVNSACVNGTTDAAGTQSGEALTPSCVTSAFNQTVWYRFTATASRMWVQTEVTTFSGNGTTWGPAAWASAVYNSTSCLPSASSIISCQNSNSVGNGDYIMENMLNGLTPGQTYLVQIGYRTGQGVNRIPDFCIRVGDQFSPVCNTCSSPCGAACGFTSNPTVAQVTSTCPAFRQYPYLEGAVQDTQCYTFTANNSTVSFNVILNSTCSGGNVTNFSWNLFQSSSCGSPIQSGNLSNLTFNGLNPGTQYTYCYSFTVPSDCYHTAHYPYFVGAVPLPVELISFEGERMGEKINLFWTTASEVNNHFFLIEKSADGIEFEYAGKINGAGNTSTLSQYSFVDMTPFMGINYYRLVQVDYDGAANVSETIAVRFGNSSGSALAFPNPSEGAVKIRFQAEVKGECMLKVYNATGLLVHESAQAVKRGSNTVSIHNELQNGTYFFQIINGTELYSGKFILE